MAERSIVIYGDPVLRVECEPVDPLSQETKDLVTDLIDTLKAARGLGLAAPQIGVPKRVFIVDLSAIDLSAQLTVFINPINSMSATNSKNSRNPMNSLRPFRIPQSKFETLCMLCILSRL